MKRTRKIFCLFLSLCMMISCMAGLSFTSAAVDDPAIIVSLGDSYSSGEGIAPYYGSEKELAERVLDHDWLAHRSKSSWGSQLKLDGVPMTRGTNWFFAAASGAEAKDISGSQSIEYDRDEYYGTAYIEPQIDIFNGLTLTANDYVTMTLGGNDVGFVDIMTVAVVTPTELDQKISDALTRFTDTVRPALKAVYKTIAEKAGDAAILVAGYPTLLNPEGFNITYMTASLPVPAETSVKVNAAVNTLNQELSALVSECADEGMNIHFVDVQSVFNGHEAYTEEEYINGICFDRSEDDVKVGIISSASIHPNEKGAAAYAAAVQAKIDEIGNPAIYTVTYDANGADGTAPVDETKYAKNAEVTVLGAGTLTKTGCTLDGWNTKADGTGTAYAAGGILTITEDTTLYAQWKINQYTITFDTDGGSKIADITQDYGTAITKPADPTKTGYTFDGWDKDIPATMPAENMTIKAKWKINQYTITFDTAGGTAIAPITQDYGTPVTAPAAPTRDGYAFTGWDRVIPATMPAENITITATWTSTTPRPYIPSYTPPATTTTTTTTTTDTTPDITKYTITGEQDEINASDLSWDAIPDASAYSLYVKVNGKYVFVQDLGKATNADIVLGVSGKYYVSTGGDYTIYEYNKKTGKFDKTGTLKASKIESIVKANNVTEDFMVKYTTNGKESAEKDSYKVSVKIYYKPAPTLTTGRNRTTGRSYIRLGWAKVEGAAAYKVCKYVDGKLRTVTELGADNLSLKINGTKSGQKYTYAVKALVNGKWTKVYASDLASIISK